MGIIGFLRKNKKIARGVFAEGEINIIEKQLNGISLNQSERNRLSRDIRRKLRFISELNSFKEDFDLKQGMRIKKIAEEAKEEILKSKYFSRIRRIVLFGSSAEGKRTFRSDIDIAVEFDKINKDDSLKFRIEVMRGLREEIDLQVINTLPDKIKREIDRNGKVIYERKDRGKNSRY